KSSQCIIVLSRERAGGAICFSHAVFSFIYAISSVECSAGQHARFPARLITRSGSAIPDRHSKAENEIDFYFLRKPGRPRTTRVRFPWQQVMQNGCQRRRPA